MPELARLRCAVLARSVCRGFYISHGNVVASTVVHLPGHQTIDRERALHPAADALLPCHLVALHTTGCTHHRSPQTKAARISCEIAACQRCDWHSRNLYPTGPAELCIRTLTFFSSSLALGSLAKWSRTGCKIALMAAASAGFKSPAAHSSTMPYSYSQSHQMEVLAAAPHPGLARYYWLS